MPRVPPVTRTWLFLGRTPDVVCLLALKTTRQHHPHGRVLQKEVQHAAELQDFDSDKLQPAGCVTAQRRPQSTAEPISSTYRAYQHGSSGKWAPQACVRCPCSTAALKHVFDLICRLELQVCRKHQSSQRRRVLRPLPPLQRQWVRWRSDATQCAAAPTRHSVQRCREKHFDYIVWHAACVTGAGPKHNEGWRE